jgi:hypothetical protein
MLALSTASVAAFSPIPASGVQWEAKPWTSSEISDQAGLQKLAVKLNPSVGYWDPLAIGEKTKEEIAWFRHAEIKHGRIAMAAFVGFLVQTVGLQFPGQLTKGMTFADLAATGGPADQWDALPTGGKLQILLVVGALEVCGESSVFLAEDGKQHYMRGGTPGYFPSKPFGLWDPLGLNKKRSAEKKEKSLLAEINNGRLAMLGIMGCISASKGLIVPGLDSLPLKPYAGEIMAPFTEINSDLPLVSYMLSLPKFTI